MDTDEARKAMNAAIRQALGYPTPLPPAPKPKGMDRLIRQARGRGGEEGRDEQ